MSEAIYVSELLPKDAPAAFTSRSGDRLPDGSVLLWEEDINRMGLAGLRNLLLEKVVLEKATVVVGRGRGGVAR